MDTIKVKLTCNHVAELPATVGKGDLAECAKCTAKRSGKGPARRRVKLVLSEAPTPADERDAADARIAELHADALAPVPEPTPEPEDDGSYDSVAAIAEGKALAAWKRNGEQGDRPATTNYERMLRAHAAGNQRTARKLRKGNGTSRPRISARRAAANARQKEVGFEGRKEYAHKLDDAELADWMRKVVAEHPDTRKEDELEVAYWIEGISVSRGRFYKVWAATFDTAGTE